MQRLPHSITHKNVNLLYGKSGLIVRQPTPPICISGFMLVFENQSLFDEERQKIEVFDHCESLTQNLQSL